MRSVISALILWTLVCPATLSADEVYLKNGDRFTGTIVVATGGKLVLKSDVAGELTLNIADVKTFSSESAVEIRLRDGTVLNQPVHVAEADHFAVEAGETLRPQTFRVADIDSINKPKPRWTGSISGGWSSTHGNTKAESISGSVSVAKRTEKDRTTASADYARGDQRDPDTGEEKTTENWWRARGKYDYFFTEKFFGFIDGRYEKDAIAALDRRILVGVGGGYQWVESDPMNFSTEFGLASRYEKFDNETDSKSEITFQLGYYFDRQLHKTVKFINETTYYPAIDKFSDYYLTSTAELRTVLVKNLFANFKVIFNYDATPAIGQGNTDVKYLFGVGLSF